MVALGLLCVCFYPITAEESHRTKLALQRMRVAEAAQATTQPKIGAESSKHCPQGDKDALLGGTAL
jgi:hypothetical protein